MQKHLFSLYQIFVAPNRKKFFLLAEAKNFNDKEDILNSFSKLWGTSLLSPDIYNQYSCGRKFYPHSRIQIKRVFRKLFSLKEPFTEPKQSFRFFDKTEFWVLKDEIGWLFKRKN